MAGQVISFRFGEQELEALKTIQQPGESLNQTAQRFLKQSLGLATPPATATMSTLLTEVDNRIAEQLAPVLENLAELEAALGVRLSVNKPVDTPRQESLLLAQIEQLRSENETLVHQNQELQQELGNAATQSPPDYKAMRDRVLERWRVAKRAESKERIAQALDEFIKELDSQRNVTLTREGED